MREFLVYRQKLSSYTKLTLLSNSWSRDVSLRISKESFMKHLALFLVSALTAAPAFAATKPSKAQLAAGSKATLEYVYGVKGVADETEVVVEVRDWRVDGSKVAGIEFSANWQETVEDVINPGTERERIKARTLSCTFTYSYDVKSKSVSEMDGECNN